MLAQLGKTRRPSAYYADPPSDSVRRAETFRAGARAPPSPRRNTVACRIENVRQVTRPYVPAYIGTWATAIEHREDQVSQVASGCHFPRAESPRKIDHDADSHGADRPGKRAAAPIPSASPFHRDHVSPIPWKQPINRSEIAKGTTDGVL